MPKMRNRLVVLLTLAITGVVTAQRSRPERVPTALEKELVAAFDKEAAAGAAPSTELHERMVKALAEEDLNVRDSVLDLFARCTPEVAVPALQSSLARIVRELDQHVMKDLYAKRPKSGDWTKRGFANSLFLGGVLHAQRIIERIGKIEDPLAETSLCDFLKRSTADKVSFNILWKACEMLAAYGTRKSLDSAIKAHKKIEDYALKSPDRKKKRVGTRHNSGINVFGAIARLAARSDPEKTHKTLAAAFETLGAKEIPAWNGKKSGKAWAALLSNCKKSLRPELPAR